MTTAIHKKVTSQGVLVPRSLLTAWGDVEEVEIEQRADVIIIKPTDAQADSGREQLVREMKADGLIETLPWPQPPMVSPSERARLAEELSHGQPLSDIILEEREERA